MYRIKSYQFSKDREQNRRKYIEKENYSDRLRYFIIIGINHRRCCRNGGTSADR